MNKIKENIHRFKKEAAGIIAPKNDNSSFGELKLMAGIGHPQLAQRIADHLGLPLVQAFCGEFDNSDLRIQRIDDVRGSDLYFLDSLHAHNSLRTVEALEFLISTCRGSANRMTGIFSWLGYCKADHQKMYGESVSVKVLADRLSLSGLSHIVLFDLHKSHIAYYFDTIKTPLKGVDHIYLMRQLIEYAQKIINFDCVAGLDDGSYKRNALIARHVQCKDVVFVYKYRDPNNQEVIFEESKVIGNVQGKKVVSFDDMIQSGGTVVESAKILKKEGAKEVNVLVVHPDFNPKTTFQAINPALEQGIIDKLVVLDTMPIENRERWHKNLIVLDPSKLIAETVRRLHEGKPMSDLFLPIT